MTDDPSETSLRLVALTWTKIDGDVIEEFVRHTALFVDRHYIVDMDSPDRTSEILEALVAEGFPITIWREPKIDVDFDTMTDHARAIFTAERADYLLLLDPDEFVVARDRGAFEEALRTLPDGVHAQLPWMTYLPTTGDDLAEGRVLARIGYRRVRETHQYYKVFLHRSFASRADWRIGAGSHSVEGAGSATEPLAGLALAHFPVRELGQIQAKGLIGWTSMIATGYDENTELAYQWRSAYEGLVAKRLSTQGDLVRTALDYLGDEDDDGPSVTFDPLPLVARVYSGPVPELAEIALAFTRQLARAYAAVRRASREDVRFALPAFAGTIDAVRHVDAPNDSGRKIDVRGWIIAREPIEPAVSVCAQVAGRNFTLEPRQSRPDVAAALGVPAAVSAGFQGIVPLDGVPLGRHDVRVAAQQSDGTWYVLGTPATFEVDQ